MRIMDAAMVAIGRLARSSAARPIVVTVGFFAALRLLGRADMDVVRMCERATGCSGTLSRHDRKPGPARSTDG
jgi:hypothetical protein